MKRNSEYVKAPSNWALHRLQAFAAGCCACFGAHASTVTFTLQQAFATPAAPYSVATADINGDGKLDVITANYNIAAEGAAVLLNTTSLNASTPSFAGWEGFAVVQNATTMTTADINTDGKPDLVVADDVGGVISVLLNTTATGAGTSSFATQKPFSVGSFGNEKPFFVTTADINGDGKRDLIAADMAIGKISVFMNTTASGALTPSFATHVDFITGSGSTSQPLSVAAVDINGDGKLDLVVANYGDNTFSVFLNTTPTNAATPSFNAQQIFTAGTGPTSVVSTDLNGDGKPDVLIANCLANTVWVLLSTTAHNASTASFGAPGIYPAGVNAQSAFSVTTGDIDGDGKSDMVVAERADNLVAVFINATAANATTPSFSAAQTFATAAYPLTVTAADVNGDGKLDLITSNSVDSSVSVLLNVSVPDRIFADGFGP